MAKVNWRFGANVIIVDVRKMFWLLLLFWYIMSAERSNVSIVTEQQQNPHNQDTSKHKYVVNFAMLSIDLTSSAESYTIHLLLQYQVCTIYTHVFKYFPSANQSLFWYFMKTFIRMFIV